MGWTLFRLAVWGAIAVWIHPRLLDLVGGHDLAIWLQRHGWVRMLAVPPLGLLGLFSMFEPTPSPRRRRQLEGLAVDTGATVVESPGIDSTHGLGDGPGLRVPLGRWSMTVARWRRKATPHTVARVQVAGVSELSFVARGAGREPAMLRGLQQSAVAFAMRDLARRKGGPGAAAVESFAFLAESPIRTGHDAIDRAVVLRSNQPEVARDLFTSGAVVAAVEALDAMTRRWDWTFYPTGSAGAAEMQIECPGALKDAESLRRVQALLQAALEHLADRGAIAS